MRLVVEMIVSDRASAAGLNVSSKVAMVITGDSRNYQLRMRMRTGSAVASRN